METELSAKDLRTMTQNYQNNNKLWKTTSADKARKVGILTIPGWGPSRTCPQRHRGGWWAWGGAAGSWCWSHSSQCTCPEGMGCWWTWPQTRAPLTSLCSGEQRQRRHWKHRHVKDFEKPATVCWWTWPYIFPPITISVDVPSPHQNVNGNTGMWKIFKNQYGLLRNVATHIPPLSTTEQYPKKPLKTQVCN